MYMKLDAVAEAAAKKLGATCKKGCAHCCYLLTLIGPSDGVVIAEHILNQENWKSWLPKLSKAAGEATYEGINKTTYFRKRLPCPFLDLATNACSIYEKRPACCRFHWVLSPPEDCSPNAPEKTKTIGINLVDLESRTWAVDFRIANDVGLPIPPAAPIPVMVIWMMEYLTRKDLDRHGEVEKYCIGLLDPMKWAATHCDSLLDEGHGIEEEIPVEQYLREQGR